MSGWRFHGSPTSESVAMALGGHPPIYLGSIDEALALAERIRAEFIPDTSGAPGRVRIRQAWQISEAPHAVVVFHLQAPELRYDEWRRVIEIIRHIEELATAVTRRLGYHGSEEGNMTRGPWTGTGFLVVGATCPTCGLSTVVYNGNYFCESAECDWAMDQEDPEHRPLADRHILRLAGVDDWGAPLTARAGHARRVQGAGPMTDMTGWYVVVRHGGVPPREWDSLGSVMFDDLDAAREFAARLDDATVYRLEAVS